MIVWYTSRRASQQGRSVGPPRPAVGGSVGSGAGRSVGSARAGEASRRPRAVEQPAECSGRSVVPSGLGYRAVGAPGDVASSEPCGTAVRSHGSDRTARGHTQRNFMGCSVTSSPTRSRRLRAAGRSVGVTRRHLRGPSHLRPGVGRSARPGSEPGARGRAGRSVGDVYQTINFEPPFYQAQTFTKHKRLSCHLSYVSYHSTCEMPHSPTLKRLHTLSFARTRAVCAEAPPRPPIQ